DRREHVRRTAELARLLNDQGLVVIAALISPSASDRDLARAVIGEERFLEVYCSASLEVCESRDDDRLFARARTGEITNVTGIDAAYEAPAEPTLDLPTGDEPVEASVDRLLQILRERGLA